MVAACAPALDRPANKVDIAIVARTDFISGSLVIEYATARDPRTFIVCAYAGNYLCKTFYSCVMLRPHETSCLVCRAGLDAAAATLGRNGEYREVQRQ